MDEHLTTSLTDGKSPAAEVPAGQQVETGAGAVEEPAGLQAETVVGAGEVSGTRQGDDGISDAGPVSTGPIADCMERLEASRERFAQAIAELERFAKHPVESPALGAEGLRSGLFGYADHVVMSSEINALLADLRQSFVETTAHVNRVIAEFERVHAALAIFGSDYAVRLGELFQLVDMRVRETIGRVEINARYMERCHDRHMTAVGRELDEYGRRDDRRREMWLDEAIPRRKKRLRPRLLYVTVVFAFFVFVLFVLHLCHAV